MVQTNMGLRPVAEEIIDVVPQTQKIKRSEIGNELELRLVANPDILAEAVEFIEAQGLKCLTVGFAAAIIVSAIVQRAAYTNGVTDGYGYSRDPNCPGYHDAGRYLREHMGHRWPELLDDASTDETRW